MKLKKIAVLTSGGDAPGMNAAIYGVFSACIKNNIKFVGVIGGYDGLIDNKFIEINYNVLEGKISSGGSLLKSGRCPRFLKPTYFKKAVKNLAENKIDALIIIGGDGTIRGAIELRNAGINVVTLPATIDNDLNFSQTIGFNSALNNIVDAIDKISDSLSAFNYGGVIKIMGSECNDLIEATSLAIHSDFVIKSSDFDLNLLVRNIKTHRSTPNLPTIVLVREDSVDCNKLAKILEEKCKFPFRPHILGYIQRGGKPFAFDRSYAYSAGHQAVELILKKEFGFTLGMQDNQIVKKSFEETIKKF